MIKRKSEREVQEIGQETLQSGRGAQPRASNDITFYDIMKKILKEIKKKLTFPKPSLSLNGILSNAPTTTP